MDGLDIKRNTFSYSWLIMELAVIFSVFSQIETIERFTRPVMYILWILAFLHGIIKNHGKLAISIFSQRFILVYITFIIYCGIIGLIDSEHLSVNYIRVMFVPLLVSIIGEMYADEDRELFNRLGKIYLICAVIFAFWVQTTYFPSYTSWLSNTIYLFKEKNSAGQIWVSAIFVTFLLVEYKTKIFRIIAYIASIYLLIMTGISQCRTALLGVSIAILAFAIYRANHKIRWLAVIAAIAIAVWKIPVTHQFIEQALFLNKYSGSDLNTFSSGRIELYRKALINFESSPIIGVGSYYVDCSYIMIATESGLIGLILIESIWLQKIVKCFQFKGAKRENIFFFMMATFYIIESILEGYPPFGPGVSSFMFWLLTSVYYSKNKILIGDTKSEQY